MPAIPNRQLSEPHSATNVYERTDQKRSVFQHLTKQRELLTNSSYTVFSPLGPTVPDEFRNCDGYDVCHSGRGHKCNFPAMLVERFIEWIRSTGERGYIGEPAEFLLAHV